MGAGVGPVGVVSAVCAGTGTVEEAVYRSAPASFPDVMRAGTPGHGLSDAARAYMRARAYLAQGNPEKATDWVLRTAGTMLVHGGDALGLAKILHDDTRLDVAALAKNPPRLVASYLCRAAEHIHAEANVCIHGRPRCVCPCDNALLPIQAPDLALRCVQVARTYCGDGNLHATLVRMQLTLALAAGCYDDAYEALVTYPATYVWAAGRRAWGLQPSTQSIRLHGRDGEERAHAVMGFIERLWMAGEVGKLCGYPYTNATGLAAVVVDAFAQLAHSDRLEADATFYDVLYAYHARRGDYKQAARWMLEYDMRLVQNARAYPEFRTLLTRRIAALALGVNALQLVPAMHQWVVMGSADSHLQSPKRPRDTDAPCMPMRGDRGTVNDLLVLEARYLHAQALLALVDDGLGSEVVTEISAAAAVDHLVERGRYDLALALAAGIRDDKAVGRALEDLAARCVHTSLAGDGQGTAAWIGHNHIPGRKAGASGQAAWRLLRGYLGQYCRQHERVARRILREEIEVPAWLEADMARLGLHVALATAYMDHARFDHACEILVDYIELLDTDMDVAATAGQAREGDALVYTDISGMLSWQLVSRVIAGLKAMPDTARADTLRQYVG